MVGKYAIAVVLAICVLFLGVVPTWMTLKGTARGDLNKHPLHREDDPELYDRMLRMRTRGQRFATFTTIGTVLVFVVVVLIAVPHLG